MFRPAAHRRNSGTRRCLHEHRERQILATPIDTLKRQSKPEARRVSNTKDFMRLRRKSQGWTNRTEYAISQRGSSLLAKSLRLCGLRQRVATSQTWLTVGTFTGSNTPKLLFRKYDTSL